MAAVLLCEDERLGRQVAVKRLHADSPEDVEQRFNREAKLGASLNHPNLVSVYDTATDGESVLIVMEYVDGHPLSRLLRHGPLRPDEVRRIVCDLGDALDHAHAQGVIHRDVKPSNVLIRKDGTPKLADLGIATASDGTKITRSGIVLGTAAYMAPEQLDGREIGPPVDIYALAAIAFEALSGTKPREGRTPMEIAHKMATEGPPDLTDAWPKAPRAAAEVLKRGMALDPHDRPATAGEFARELANALEEQPRQPAPLPPSRRFRRSAPAAAAVAAEPVADPVASNGADGGVRTPTARGPRARPRREGRRPGLAVMVLAIALIALAAAAIAGSVFSGGDDSSSSAGNTPAAPAKKKPANAKKQKAKAKANKDAGSQAQAPAASPPAAAEPPPSSGSGTTSGSGSTSYDPARGAQLNDEGYRLMNQGDYAGAVDVLQQAVNSFPPGTSDLNYAYALYNLGRSLRLAGRPDEAIPVLEKRLRIPNQTETVQRELDLAKQQAGQS
jgi:eukaryotic-like serine/threonine-protein kinase